MSVHIPSLWAMSECLAFKIQLKVLRSEVNLQLHDNEFWTKGTLMLKLLPTMPVAFRVKKVTISQSIAVWMQADTARWGETGKLRCH